MNSAITSALVGVGKQVYNSLVSNDASNTAIQEGQMQRFDQRLEQAMNPGKASFNQFLDENFVTNMKGVEFLSDKVKNALLSDPELETFVAQNGGFSGDFTIEKENSCYRLKSESGQEFRIDANSELSETVEQLHYLESVRQLGAAQPGMSLDRLVDLAFENSNTLG